MQAIQEHFADEVVRKFKQKNDGQTLGMTYKGPRSVIGISITEIDRMFDELYFEN